MAESRRFMRTKALLGEEGFLRLQSATVMIVGLGAVGGYALEALARAGIGHLILVDFDKVDETNINRQILALSSTIGRPKTEIAAARVKEINPDCRVELREVFVNADSLPALLDNAKVDMVVDAIDSLNPKCGLMEALYRRNIPFISSMGAALKTDPSHIRLQKLKNTRNCHLARFVRKRLARRGVDTGKIVCVASDEQNALPETALFMEENATRHTMGSLPTITAIFGLNIANEVIMRISRGQI